MDQIAHKLGTKDVDEFSVPYPSQLLRMGLHLEIVEGLEELVASGENQKLVVLVFLKALFDILGADWVPRWAVDRIAGGLGQQKVSSELVAKVDKLLERAHGLVSSVTTYNRVDHLTLLDDDIPF